MVDDLLLEQRRAKLGERLRIVAVEVVDLLLLTRELPDPGEQGLVDLIVRDLDIGRLADLRKHQAEADAPLGDLAVLRLRGLLGGALVLEGLAAVLQVLLDLRPHGGELLVDKARRQLEGVLAVERVEQLLLELAAGLRLVIGTDRLGDGLLQLLQVVHAEALGELIVDLGLAGRGDRLHGHVELGILTGELLGLVIGREGHLDQTAVADLGTDELVLEAGNEGVGAEFQIDVLTLAALELGAVDAADEIDGDAVAGLRLGALLARLEGAAVLGHPLQGLVDLLVGGLQHELLDRHVGEIGELEARQHLELHLEGEVALGIEGTLDDVLLLVLRELDLRLEGEAQALVSDDLLVSLVDGVLQNVGHHRLAVDLAQMRHRHLAGAEALDLDLALDVRELGVEAILKLVGGEEHLKLALQPLGGRLGHLHRRSSAVF